MQRELSIIKLCLNYEKYQAISSLTSPDMLPKELQGMYRTLDRFHKEHPNNNISVDDLANLYTPVKDTDFYNGVYDTLKKIEVNELSVKELLQQTLRQSLARKISMAAYEASEGNEKSKDALQELFDSWKSISTGDERKTDEFAFTSSDLETLLSTSVLKPGLRWRLDSLNKSLGSLRKGDSGDVIARVETGKTTWVCSEVSFMAEQEACTGPIILFNNEEQDNKVMIRMYQASLGYTLEQLYSNIKQAEKLFLEKTKGKILIPAFKGRYSAKDVEKYCAKLNPSLIVFDQKDKVLGFKDDRKDQELAAIAIWARDLAKEYCPVIGIGQADGTGEGQKWLTTAHMSNAKTDKPAESDWILGIGKIPDAGYEMLRFFHLSKNKLMGDKDTDPNRRHGKWEVLIEPTIGRYKDL